MFHSGDLVWNAKHGLGVVGEVQGDGFVWVCFDHSDECLSEMEMVLAGNERRFWIGEPTNFDERRAWWRQLTPIYEGVPAKLCCTPEILVSTFASFVCKLSRVATAPVTVEHDDDGWRQCDLSREVWLDKQNVWQFEFNGHDNHDFQLDDFESFWLHRWPTVHAVVAQCEVTL